MPRTGQTLSGPSMGSTVSSRGPLWQFSEAWAGAAALSPGFQLLGFSSSFEQEWDDRVSAIITHQHGLEPAPDTSSTRCWVISEHVSQHCIVSPATSNLYSGLLSNIIRRIISKRELIKPTGRWYTLWLAKGGCGRVHVHIQFQLSHHRLVKRIKEFTKKQLKSFIYIKFSKNIKRLSFLKKKICNYLQQYCTIKWQLPCQNSSVQTKVSQGNCNTNATYAGS